MRNSPVTAQLIGWLTHAQPLDSKSFGENEGGCINHDEAIALKDDASIRTYMPMSNYNSTNPGCPMSTDTSTAPWNWLTDTQPTRHREPGAPNERLPFDCKVLRVSTFDCKVYSSSLKILPRNSRTMIAWNSPSNPCFLPMSQWPAVVRIDCDQDERNPIKLMPSMSITWYLILQYSNSQCCSMLRSVVPPSILFVPSSAALMSRSLQYSQLQPLLGSGHCYSRHARPSSMATIIQSPLCSLLWPCCSSIASEAQMSRSLHSLSLLLTVLQSSMAPNEILEHPDRYNVMDQDIAIQVLVSIAFKIKFLCQWPHARLQSSIAPKESRSLQLSQL